MKKRRGKGRIAAGVNYKRRLPDGTIVLPPDACRDTPDERVVDLRPDGKLVSNCISPYQTDNGSNGVVFGLGSRGYGGAFEVDYVRWTTEGAYVPYVPPKGFGISIK